VYCCLAGTALAVRYNSLLNVKATPGYSNYKPCIETGHFFAACSPTWTWFCQDRYGIASRYAELVPDEILRHTIFNMIETEWQRTVDMLFAITGDHFAGSNPTLARSLTTRTPYIDPLNHCKWGYCTPPLGDTHYLVKRAIHLTINGIAAGLRNSG